MMLGAIGEEGKKQASTGRHNKSQGNLAKVGASIIILSKELIKVHLSSDF
jgi:hypothetical protein